MLIPSPALDTADSVMETYPLLLKNQSKSKKRKGIKAGVSLQSDPISKSQNFSTYNILLAIKINLIGQIGPSVTSQPILPVSF